MIDDFCCKNLDAFIFSEISGFWGDFDIKSKQSCELFMLSCTTCICWFDTLEDILFVYGTDVNWTNWDFLLVQEFKQRFKWANCWRLNTNAFCCLVNILLENVNQIIWDALLRFFYLFLITAFKQFGTSNGKLHIRCTDLNSHSSFDLLMMLVVSFNTHLLHGVRSQQSPNLGHNWSI